MSEEEKNEEEELEEGIQNAEEVEDEGLSRNEKDLNVILEALERDLFERRKAVARLRNLFAMFSDEEGQLIITKLGEANKAENRMNRPLQLKMASLLKMYEDFPTKEERIAEVERIKNEAKLEAAQKEKTEELRKEKIRKEEEARKLRKQNELEENLELAKYTLVSREAKSRLPAFQMVRNLYLVLGTLYIVAGIITIFIVPSTLGFGVLALLAGISILFFFQAEIIRYFSDSHDANYMNLKVRIETLKVLEKISENLKK